MKSIGSKVLVPGILVLALVWQAYAQTANPDLSGARPVAPVNVPVDAFRAGIAPLPAEGVGKDESLRKLHGEEMAAEAEVAKLLQEYAGSTEDQRAKVRTRLSAALEKQFDLQQKRREHDAAQIDEQLKKLRELLKKRNDARQSIVERRLDQLVREADGLGWTPPPTSIGTKGYIPANRTWYQPGQQAR